MPEINYYFKNFSQNKLLMPVSSLNIRLFTKLNMIMSLIEYFNPISCASGGLRFYEKYHIGTQN